MFLNETSYERMIDIFISSSNFTIATYFGNYWFCVAYEKMLSHIYRFFRPKNVEDAANKKMYLAMAYGFLSWNCFMYMFYKIVISQLPTNPEEQSI